MKTIPERNDHKREDTWDITPIYASREAFLEAIAQTGQDIRDFARFENNTSDADALLEALKALYALKYRIGHIYCYANLHQDEDARDQEAQSDYQRARQLVMRLDEATAFFVPQVLALREDALLSWISGEAFADYRFPLEEILRMKKHTLSPREEQLMAMAGDVVNAPHDIYTMLTTVDMVFPTIKDEQGQEVEVSTGRFIPLMESRDRRVRKDAFTANYEKYASQVHVYSASLLAQAQANTWNARARGYGSAMEASMYPSGISKDAYTALVERLHANLPLMHEYVALRAKVLGLSGDLHMYDLYVPIAQQPEKEYSFAESRDLVLESVAPLGAPYQNAMRRAFDERWIDVYENRGKRSGAYMQDVYGVHPYILLNHQGNLDSVFTLAHELGHAMQSVLSDEAQPYPVADYDLFIAEVASTFNEQLLLEHLLKHETDTQTRLYLLNHAMESVRTTAYRQTMFEEFEEFVHDTLWRNEPLTADDMCAQYKTLNEVYYGDAIDVDPLIAYEWARIPHFYYNFYVYQYATGLCSALSLCKDVLSSGDPSRYLRFLSEGGSRNPMDILIDAGVGLLDGSYIDAANADFKEKMQAYEALL